MNAAGIARTAAIIAAALIVGLHFLKPDLDPGSRFLSEYANGRFGWLMTLAFLAWAVATGSLVASLYGCLKTTVGRLGLGFLAVATLGLAVAAMFPIDGPGSPQGGTRTGMLHGLSALLGMPTVPIGAMLVSVALLRQAPAWLSRRGPLLVLANLTWISLLLMVLYMVWAMRGGGAPEAGGWMNRLVVSAYLAWTIYVAHGIKPALSSHDRANG